MNDPIAIIYKSIGSDEAYYKLVDFFYAEVEKDTLLRPLYPADLTDAKRHLALFLIQRTGGPQTYSNERGHPRMRMRHMPFPIGIAERNAWLTNMSQALKQTPEFANHREVLEHYFLDFATFLMNKADETMQPPG
ncbi:MAG: globin [Candidatus Obscuribacterales bacterium]|jgi:hemoglobin|nr:globin [Candidatus Obscuribacterales bacterium]